MKVNKMKIPIETIWLPRPATKYKGCFPLHFERRIPKLLNAKRDDIIHLFSGSSKLGYTVDINPKCKPDKVCNAEDLSDLPSNFFYAGLADPPYNERFAKELYNCEYPKWGKWTKELVRVVKPSGLIGIMQNYIVPRLPGCEYEKILVILLRIKQFPKILTIQRKRK